LLPLKKVGFEIKGRCTKWTFGV